MNINKIISLLRKQYPDAKCSLIYTLPHELLIAGRLSSQCTDQRVNITTKVLFSKYKSLEDFANAKLDDIKEIIKPCGLFNTKAENIINMCKVIVQKFSGQIPDSIDELILLPGIGRKTANLILGEIFKKPAIICDTHCIRISNLLGLCDSKNPEKVESQLRKILPPKQSCLFCHMLVSHGREICKARNPNCKNCPINKYCQFYLNKNNFKINSLRNQIDIIDEQIITLLDNRLEIALKIAKEKKENQINIIDKKREDKIISKLQKIKKKCLSNSAVEKIYKEILSNSVAKMSE